MAFPNRSCIFNFVLKDLNNIHMTVLTPVFKDWFFFIYNKVISKIPDLVPLCRKDQTRSILLYPTRLLLASN